MYEHRYKPLLSRKAFLLRLAGHGGAALGPIFASIVIGVAITIWRDYPG
jgi:hypothetical protein